MLTVRASQLSAFQEAADRCLAIQIAEWLQATYPMLALAQQPSLANFVAAGLNEARAAGLEGASDLAAYVALDAAYPGWAGLPALRAALCADERPKTGVMVWLLQVAPAAFATLRRHG